MFSKMKRYLLNIFKNTSTNYQCDTGRNEYADCKNGKFRIITPYTF